jgi:hypothetical protein
MASRKPDPARERVEQARLLYDAGIVPVDEIAAMLRMSRDGFYRFRQREGWAPRLAFGRHRHRDGVIRSAPELTVRDLSPDEFVAQLETMIGRELAGTQHALAHDDPTTAERKAKVMASLVRSVAELKRMPRGVRPTERHDDGADEPPARDLPARDLDELKAELARRLDRLRRSRDAE